MGVVSATRAFGSGAAGGTARDLDPSTALGDWRIEARIGEGGMGTVYAAVHEVIGKRAAIKVIRSEVCTSPRALERFLQEARIVNRIRHRNIIDIFHVGQLDDGRPYLVMELLVGATLGERLDAGPIPAIESIDILVQICAALEAAHSHGVVHRDLKPDNVILAAGPGGNVAKLLDWGIAKIRDPARPDDGSVGGTLLGTPRYVAPEQARGRRVGGATDVYSLGVIAYELFLGAPPFAGDNAADLLAAHLCEEPPPPHDSWPDIPAELDALLLAMLAKDPEARPGVAAVAETLGRIRLELLRRAGQVEAPGEAPPVAENLAVPVGDWSDAPAPPPVEAQALLDTRLDLPQGRRTGTAAFVVATLAAFAVVLVAAQLGRGRRGVPDAAAASALAAEQRRVLAAPRVPPSVLDLRVRPVHARIVLDGVVVEGEAGRVLETVAPGAHEVVVTAPGFDPYRRTIEVGAAPVTLAIDLAPADARRRPARRTDRAPDIDPDDTIDPFR